MKQKRLIKIIWISLAVMLANIAGVVAFNYNFFMFGNRPLTLTGDAFYITEKDAGTDWTGSFVASGGSGSYTFSLPVNPGGAAVDGSGNVTLDRSVVGKYNITVRVTDNGNSQFVDLPFVVDVYENGVCVWNGVTSTAWDTATNWSYCGGNAPINTSKVAIPDTAPNMPILSTSTTVDTFGFGPGGGTLTINTSRSLSLNATTANIQSSVKLLGSTTTCTSCLVYAPITVNITDGAALDLSKGIGFRNTSTGTINVGNGTTGGTLKASGGATEAEKPMIGVTSSWSFGRIILNGSAGQKAKLDIDGLRLNFYNTGAVPRLTFQDHYQIVNFDNVTFGNSQPNPTQSDIFITSCANGTFSDLNWDAIKFDITHSGSYNVNASAGDCSAVGPIEISNPTGLSGGPGYGPNFENDPNNRVNWANSVPKLCTWTGNSDTMWNNPGNWSGCDNGQGDYPGSSDEVLIPDTVNKPVLNASYTIKSFGAGTGGGTLTINAGMRLTVLSATEAIKSDITIKGSTNTCTTCLMYTPYDMYIVNNAVLTMDKGSRAYAGMYGTDKVIRVGNGVTGGTLATTGGTVEAEKPVLTGDVNTSQQVVLEGAAGNLAKLNINGLVFNGYGGAYSPFLMKNYYELIAMDGITVDVNGSTFTNKATFEFESCANIGTIVATWSNIKINDPHVLGNSYNVKSENANCSALGPILISNAAGDTGGPGYGPLYEKDPNSRIDWANGNSFICTWNGSVSDQWTNSSNWTNCANGRGNYPDQLDDIIIPTGTPNSARVSSTSFVHRIADGVGGGVVTLNNSVNFRVLSTTMNSSVSFQGNTATCTTCFVLGSLNVINSSTLGLGTGALITLASIGNGTSPGHLKTIHSSTLNTEWPRLGYDNNISIVVKGSSTSNSTVDVNGLRIRSSNFYKSIFDLDSYYTINKFDSVEFDHTHSHVNNEYIRFKTCTGAVINDAIWSNINFVTAPNLGAGHRNVEMVSATCSTATPINFVSAIGAGAGATYESDTYGLIRWNAPIITGPTLVYGQVGTAWSSSGIITISGGTGSYTFTLPTAPGGASVDGSGVITFTPGSSGPQTFVLRATDNGNGEIAEHTFQLDALATDTCLWVGTTNTTWSTATNWNYCDSAAPTSSKKVVIKSDVSNQPIVTASTTVDSFGFATGGGTVTLNVSVTLNVTNATDTFRSSVAFKGATTTCTNCRVQTSNTSVYIKDAATLNLGKGVNLYATGGIIYVGDGTTGGTLKTEGGATENEKPLIGAGVNWSYTNIIFNGASGKIATSDFNGARLQFYSGSNSRLRYQNYYNIAKFDNVTFYNTTPSGAGNSNVNFESCTNGTFTDTNWDGIYINVMTAGMFNINASHATCSGISNINIANASGQPAGGGYGSAYEKDDHGKLFWANEETKNCTWIGLTTTWTEPTNWSNCTNGRGNYPNDQDFVIVPSAPSNQPIVAANLSIQGFALSGGGGGTVTVNSGITFTMLNTTMTYRSDIQLKGQTDTCTSCTVHANQHTISDNATLTLLKGIRIQTPTGGTFNVGNGTTGGTLATGPAGASNEWPTIYIYGGSNGQIRFNGASGSRAILRVNGLKSTGHNYDTGDAFRFIDWFDIEQMDNVSFDAYSVGDSPRVGSSYIDLESCANSTTLSQYSWNNLQFLRPVFQSSGEIGYNIKAVGPNCENLSSQISVSNYAGTTGGPGYGALFEKDDHNKINWANSTSYTCTWTGAANTVWTNSANWSGCTNGRLNYPDQLDRAIIPPGPANQPVVSVTDYIYGFAQSSSGGGIVTINAGITLYLINTLNSVQSDVKFQGATAACTTCAVNGIRYLRITNDAKVTLLKGIILRTGSQGHLYVGDGTTGGTLATDGGSTSSEWPRFNNNIRFLGTSTSRAKADINGLHIEGAYPYTSYLNFEDWFEIVKLNNFSVKAGSTSPNNSGIAFVELENCTNSYDKIASIWDGHVYSISAGSGKNIIASHASCSSMNAVNMINYSGTGTGAAFENDPHNKIKWNAPQISGPTLIYTQAGSAWSSSGIITISGGTGSYTFTLPTAPGGASVDGSGVITFTPATAGPYSFVLRATDNGNGEFWEHTFQLDALETDTCLWTGGTSTAWETAGNWTYCGGTTPTLTNKVVVKSDASNQPILATSTTIDSFGIGTGGGTLTVNATRALTLNNNVNTISSSISIKGQTNTCTNCQVYVDGNTYVLNGATLTLLSGAFFDFANNSTMRLGNGTTAGHLTAVGGATSTEWPTLGNSGYGESLYVNGSATTKSKINVNGLKIQMNFALGKTIELDDYYEIVKFDRVSLNAGSTIYGVASPQAVLKFNSCTNATVSDTSWTDITIVDTINTGGKNIKASGTNCSGLPIITIANTAGETGGAGYGAQYEDDPNNKLNWANSSAFTCTWTGAVNTAWANSANWSGCANGRGDIPTAIDSVIIPVTANQPVISSNVVITAIAAGTGGGTVTVNSGITFALTQVNDSIQSDIVLQGSSTTCSNCTFRGMDDLEVTNGAKVTLLKGIYWHVFQHDHVFFGDGVTSGHLATGPAGTYSEWPTLGYSGYNTSIRFKGASGDKSTIDVDGIKIRMGYQSGKTIEFEDYFVFENFDNVEMNGGSTIYGLTTIGVMNITNCTNSLTHTDTNWTGISFIDKIHNSSGYNIKANGTGCSSFPTITITNPTGESGGAGYGTRYELDPGAADPGIFDWNNSGTFDCVWTGTANTVWTNSANWSNCGNSRGGYPGALDTARIPATANQPLITAETVVGRIGTGVGGGEITVNSNITFIIMSTTESIRSSIAFKGSVTTCTTCYFRGLSNIRVTDGATVTLNKGITWTVPQNTNVAFGDGTTSGHLATGAAGAANEWPTIGSGAYGTYVQFRGVSGDKSLINIDGINVYTHNVAVKPFDIYGYVKIDKFDNVKLGTGTLGVGQANIQFSDCTAVKIDDPIWDNIQFNWNIGSGYSVRADGTNCNGLDAFTFTNYSGPSSGAAYEQDPNNVVGW